MELSNGHRGGSSLSRAVPNIGSPFVDEYYGELDSSWSPIEGDHFQFVRHSDGQAWLLPGAPAAEIWDFTWAEEARPAQHVSADGSCAVYWATDREGWAQLRLVQIESGPLPEELLGEAVVEGHEAGPAVFFSN